MSRAVPEWCGKTPDSKVPDHVRLRVFRNANGICHISGRKIAPGERWELEHVIPLHAGGENRESNLRPALVDHHKEKTAAEMARKAKADAQAKAALGIKREPRQTIKSAGFPAKQRAEKLPIPPRRIDVYNRRVT